MSSRRIHADTDDSTSLSTRTWKILGDLKRLVKTSLFQMIVPSTSSVEAPTNSESSDWWTVFHSQRSIGALVWFSLIGFPRSSCKCKGDLRCENAFWSPMKLLQWNYRCKSYFDSLFQPNSRGRRAILLSLGQAVKFAMLLWDDWKAIISLLVRL